MVKNSLEFVEVSLEQVSLIEEFIKLAGSSLDSFRYFEKRPNNCIRFHYVTVLILEDDKPLAYGHLDSDDGITWLGIAVIEDAKGMGLGTKMMTYLLEKAKEKKLDTIVLSVDRDNSAAISLYKKFGFEIVKDLSKQSLLMNYTLSE